MKILNLFAGIGGNRELWDYLNCVITSVEYDGKIAILYKELFPNDKIIIGDAYEYLEKNYNKFDFIWASPPCVSHSRININFNQPCNIRLPDLKLYSIILFLQQWFKGNWIIENVRPFYKPLIKPTCIRGRHIYWSNIPIPSDKKISPAKQNKLKINKINRNKVDPKEGKILMDYLINKKQLSIEVFK